MGYTYRGVWIQACCPNRCFEKLVDQGIAMNRIDGVDPAMYSYNAGSTSFDIRRWSHKLKRHSHRAQGHYISLAWSHCPFCGKKLVEAGEDGI